MATDHGLLGREQECGRLDRLVADVRSGASRVLVVRGSAGVGKTALLEHVVANSAGCVSVRAAGVEAEMELAFAGLHALCAPLLGGLPRLPGPQRAALSTAFGLEAGPPPDRFMVGLAVLSLLADASESQPLLCVVDDAQWLDRVSAQTLAFVARRLLAERVGLVFGLREDAGDFRGLPELVVEGLAPAAARALLDRVIPGPLDDRVRNRILAEAAGNPLGLLELPRGLTPMGFDVPAPLASRLEQGFVRQLAPLPQPARRLLLLAAAEPLGDTSLLRAAAQRLELGRDASEAVEDSGLVEIGAQARFRHPLVRSAVYRAAAPAERRSVHGALAEAERDPDRRAWHRARAAAGLDEAVAGELERSAGRARNRGGVVAAAAFLAQAAELTPDPGRRGRRALAAAQAKYEAAAFESADELASLADACPLDDLQRARLARLRAQMTFARRRGKDAPPLLLAAARGLEALDPPAAREAYVEALDAALVAGRLHAEHGVREAAQAALAAPAVAGPPRTIDLALDGLAVRFTRGPAAGAPALRAALDAFAAETPDGHEQTMRWLALCPLVQAIAIFELWDGDAYHALATRAVALARRSGALNVLPFALWSSAAMEMFAGDFAACSALLQEADAIRAATGTERLVLGGLGIAAWRGREADALRVIDAAHGNALARGEARVVSMAGCCAGILHNGLGQYEQALEAAKLGSDDDDQWYTGWSLVELVEAAARSGRPQLAADALRRLEERTRAAGTDWGLGVLARSRALVAGSEDDHREAIERLGRTRVRIEALRAHLVYGEWLRREQRRRDAREQLRIAHDAFSAIGAEAYAERARRELGLTGETVPRRTAATRDVLTAQEAQVARMARSGLTNPEIAAELFISPRTVEYHLRKVFIKLGIAGRKDLRGVLDA